jgi:hypothetical protein
MRRPGWSTAASTIASSDSTLSTAIGDAYAE